MSATLVFLPGTLCDSRVWQPVCMALHTEYACINWDYPPDDSIAAMAARVLAAVPGPLLPVGLSMGGIVALEIWRQAPERVDALALFGTNPGPDAPERRQGREDQLALAQREGLAHLARERLAPAYLAPDGAGLEPFTSTVADMASDTGIDVFAGQSHALAGRADSWPDLPHIDVPVLVVYGSADRVCPKDGHLRMASLLRRASCVELPGAGHLAPLEEPGLAEQALRAWLNRR